MIWRIQPLQRRSLTWTPPLYFPVVSPSWVSTRPSIPSIRHLVFSTPTSSEQSITKLLVVYMKILQGFSFHFFQIPLVAKFNLPHNSTSSPFILKKTIGILWLMTSDYLFLSVSSDPCLFIYLIVPPGTCLFMGIHFKFYVNKAACL